MPSRVQGARGRITRILPVPALCRREKGTGEATRIITPETVVEMMLETEENWTAVSSSVTAVMKRLRDEEQERRKMRGPTTAVPV